jgi:hypothetical protein
MLKPCVPTTPTPPNGRGTQRSAGGPADLFYFHAVACRVGRSEAGQRPQTAHERTGISLSIAIFGSVGRIGRF